MVEAAYPTLCWSLDHRTCRGLLLHTPARKLLLSVEDRGPMPWRDRWRPVTRPLITVRMAKVFRDELGC